MKIIHATTYTVERVTVGRDALLEEVKPLKVSHD